MVWSDSHCEQTFLHSVQKQEKVHTESGRNEYITMRVQVQVSEDTRRDI